MNALRTIMLIDDEPINHLICHHVIAQFDAKIEMIEYDKPREALAFLDEQSKSIHQKLPDIIFLDLNMPLMDGWHFLEKFKELIPSFNQKVEIFLLTSSDFEGDIKKAKSFPTVSYYVTKPLTVNFLEKISSLQLSDSFVY